MRITGFNPMIVTRNSKEAIKVFESLGFRQTHQKSDIDIDGIANTRMKNDDGFHLDILQSESNPGDITTIKINVDNFDESYKELIEKGFVNVYGDDAKMVSASSIECLLKAPSGYTINLCEHLK